MQVPLQTFSRERGRKYHFGAQGMRYRAEHEQPHWRGQQLRRVLVLPLNPGVQLIWLLDALLPFVLPC